MVKHVQNCATLRLACHRKDTHGDETKVRYGCVSDQTFDVLRADCQESTVHNGNNSKDHNQRCECLTCIWEQGEAITDHSESSDLVENAKQEN